MALRQINGDDFYPGGMTGADPHFFDDPDLCPHCDQEIYGDVCCPFCGCPLEEPDSEDWDYDYDLEREMEGEGR